MGPGEITVQVNVGDDRSVPAGLLERAVRVTLEAEGYPRGEISLTLLDDEAMREMNRTYLGRDRPTDVISFALGDEDSPLGDVYVGSGQARRQAEELGIEMREELVRLAVHGTLHVVGCDHPEDRREESPMYARQEALVSRVLGGEG